jgi:hypoxanthine phosphoribosyltransferase
MTRLFSDIPSVDPLGTPERIEVGWDEYYGLVEELAVLVYRSGYSFDTLLCVARGGLRVGDVFSRVFRVPLSILAASSYREAAGTQRGELDIAHFITGTQGDPRGKMLLVDDMVDSGVTLERVCRHLRERFAGVSELRTAVLWSKGGSAFRPDFVVRPLAGDPWIVQPFEVYDSIGVAELAKKRQGEGK